MLNLPRRLCAQPHGFVRLSDLGRRLGVIHAWNHAHKNPRDIVGKWHGTDTGTINRGLFSAGKGFDRPNSTSNYIDLGGARTLPSNQCTVITIARFTGTVSTIVGPAGNSFSDGGYFLRRHSGTFYTSPGASVFASYSGVSYTTDAWSVFIQSNDGAANGERNLWVDGVKHTSTSAVTWPAPVVRRIGALSAEGHASGEIFTVILDGALGDEHSAWLGKDLGRVFALFEDAPEMVFLGEIAGGGTNATGDGAPASLSLTPPAGAATGGATVAGAPAGITISPIAGDGGGTSSVTADGPLAALTLAAITGAATGGATGQGVPAAITLAAPAGAATGSANVAGAPAGIVLAPIAGNAGAAAVDATGDGAPAAITLTAALGTATGSAAVSGALAGISIAAPVGVGGDPVAATLAAARAGGYRNTQTTARPRFVQ